MIRVHLPPTSSFGATHSPPICLCVSRPQKEGFRLNDYSGFQGRYNSPRMRSQLEVYQNIAEKYGMSVHQLATAFVHNK